MASNCEIAKEGIWYWQSNTNPFSKTEEKQWTRFSDIENEFIEAAHLEKDDKVSLHTNYYINLKRMLQVSKHDKNKQRPIKREKVRTVREQRFTIDHQFISSQKSLAGAPGEKPKFINEWIRRNNIDSHYLKEENAEEIVLEAAKGIEEEGKLRGKEEEGIGLSKLLRASKQCSLLALSQTCVHIYSMESFLYIVVNQCLRLDDMSKISILGPFCFLLYNSLWLLRSSGEITLYRSIQMNEDILEGFKANIGKQQSWKAFTSTSSDRMVAENFGASILFIISVVQIPFKPAYWTDISKYSSYPSEREVLLPIAVTYMINKVEYDHETKKHVIHVTI